MRRRFSAAKCSAHSRSLQNALNSAVSTRNAGSLRTPDCACAAIVTATSPIGTGAVAASLGRPPEAGVAAPAAEAVRCHKAGLRGINMNNHPQSHGLPDLGDKAWDRLWEVCSDLNLPVNFHIGASDESTAWFTDMPWPSQTADQKLALGSAMLFVNNDQAGLGKFNVFL